MSTTSNSDVTGARIRWRLLVPLALLTVAVSGLAVNPASAASPTTPFSASTEGTVAATGETSFALAGSGKAIHLGQVSYQGDVQVTSVDPETGVITDVLTETLTAANGDTLTLLCTQVATPVAPGVYLGSDQWTVIGGTGRFSGATGSGTGETHVDLNAGTFSKASTGTLTIER